MKVTEYLINFFYRRQKLLEALAILLVCLAASFRIGSEVAWIWNPYPFIALLLLSGFFLSALLWIKVEKRKLNQRIKDILAEKNTIQDTNQKKINELTTKQRDIYELILQGKSNKEITHELFIELSTLKTHINQIYKKLGITSRKEARGLGTK